MTITFINRFFILLLMFVLSFYNLGCSSGTISHGKVTGVVTLDGQPLPGIIVVCKPLDQPNFKSAEGITNNEGVYELITSSDIRGVPLGKCKMSVTLPEVTEGTKLPEILTKIPPQYFKPFHDAEIKTGSNKIDIKLESK